MAQYTIDDIEILRQKSGISYEEAVNLLEYHNGSLARALVDLEKNGRLKGSAGAESGSKSGKGWKGLFSYLFRLRLRVKKDETTVINLSSLFMVLVLLTAPHIVVIGLLLVLVLGYRISVERNSKAFGDKSLDDMIKGAKSNVQNSVSSFTRQFGKTEAEEPRADAPRTENAASGTRPVNVPFSDGGSVDVHDGGDGYHEADIQ